MEEKLANVERIVEKYGNMIFRICIVILGNEKDAEDVVQETVLKYFQKAPQFKSYEHEKAWLITVAKNKCYDFLRARKRQSEISIEQKNIVASGNYGYGVLEALMCIPEKFRIVLILYYVDGYKVEEIAKIIKKTSSAVKMRLKKGRELLEEKYRKEYL